MSEENKHEEQGKYISLADVKNLLRKAAKEREELNYEQKQALNHAETFAKLPAGKANDLAKEIRGLEFVPEVLVYKIVDLLPLHEDDVRAVFAKSRMTLEAAQINQIIDIVGKYYVE